MVVGRAFEGADGSSDDAREFSVLESVEQNCGSVSIGVLLQGFFGYLTADACAVTSPSQAGSTNDPSAPVQRFHRRFKDDDDDDDDSP